MKIKRGRMPDPDLVLNLKSYAKMAVHLNSNLTHVVEGEREEFQIPEALAYWEKGELIDDHWYVTCILHELLRARVIVLKPN